MATDAEGGGADDIPEHRTAGVSLPSYDVNLFLDGITQASTGDPVGLVNAVGDPIAADVGLVTVAGGVEGLVLVIGAVSALRALAGI